MATNELKIYSMKNVKTNCKQQQQNKAVRSAVRQPGRQIDILLPAGLQLNEGKKNIDILLPRMYDNNTKI